MPTARVKDRQSSTNAPLHCLENHQCRFPIHEDHTIPGWYLFCGATVAPGSPFCPEHHDRCFTPKLRLVRR
ncbi:hypothetical protein GOC14_07115 [Sinorhizobium meliloti]|nr:hypothetical protein [Sinorhizobium meliloti]